MNIVYKELSTIEKDLGFSRKFLYKISNNIDSNYKTIEIPKNNGETRELHVPRSYLKSIQNSIARVILSRMPVSNYATAYRKLPVYFK